MSNTGRFFSVTIDLASLEKLCRIGVVGAGVCGYWWCGYPLLSLVLLVVLLVMVLTLLLLPLLVGARERGYLLRLFLL